MQNDQLWKSILEDTFEDFLTFFYPETEQMFDFGRGFVYLDKELRQLFPPEKGKHDTRYVDKLVQVYRREGEEQWVLIHVEVQGTVFLKNYVRFEDNEFDNKFEVELEKETQSTMGIAEYLLVQEREKTRAERKKARAERE